MTGTFAATVLMWLLGISDSGVGRRGKLAFGYVHPNYVAQVVMILVLLWLVEKGNRERFLRYVLTEAAAVAILFLTGSKTADHYCGVAPGGGAVPVRGLSKEIVEADEAPLRGQPTGDPAVYLAVGQAAAVQRRSQEAGSDLYQPAVPELLSVYEVLPKALWAERQSP